ncbi:MAG: PAS domain-containing protein [Deinococcales bacterium]|nr:PAS domain-containing protein [Chitinophagaceae bacterium]
MQTSSYYNQIFQVIPIPSLLVNPNTNFSITEANTAYLNLRNTTLKTIVGKSIFEIMPHNPENDNIYALKKLKESLEIVVSTAKSHKIILQQFFIPTKDDATILETKYWLIENTPILNQSGTVDSILHSVVDNTELRQNEDKIKDINKRYKYLTKATSDVIWDWDMTNNNVHWDEAFSTVFGYDFKQIKPDINFLKEHVHPKEQKRVEESFYNMINGSATNWVEQFRFLKGDNTYAYVTNKGFIIRNAEGIATRFVGAIRDITVKKQEEFRLKLLESVIVNTEDCVVITEAETAERTGSQIIYVNDAFTKTTGYTLEEVLGKTPRILQGSKTDSYELSKLNQAIKEWQPHETTIVNYKKNGDAYWVTINITPIADETGWFTHWIAIERDVTEKKLYELNMMKAIIKTQEDERYEIGGELHDNVCQILTASQITLKLFKKLLIDKNQARLDEGLEYIFLAVNEIRNLSHRLAPAFFDDTSLEQSFNALLKKFNTSGSYKTNLYFSAKFKRYNSKRDFQINLYRILQEQLSNILKYAQATSLKIVLLIENDMLKMSISDNGVGFNVSSAKNGIGFANMKRRVELFSGKFKVVSSLGNGCKILLEIPLQEIE